MIHRLALTSILAIGFATLQDSAVLTSHDTFVPCTAVERAEAVHTISPSAPLIIELSYNVFAKKLYEVIFGESSSESESHKRNFKCTQEFVTKVQEVVDRFISRVKRLVDTRSQALQTSYPRFRREIEKRNYLRWRRRTAKRSTGVWLATLSVASLFAQLSLDIYFGAKLVGLSQYISDVELQMNNDWHTSEIMIENIKLLKREQAVVACRIDALYFSLNAGG